MTLLAGILIYLAGIVTGVLLFILFFIWSFLTGRVM